MFFFFFSIGHNSWYKDGIPDWQQSGLTNFGTNLDISIGIPAISGQLGQFLRVNFRELLPMIVSLSLF